MVWLATLAGCRRGCCVVPAAHHTRVVHPHKHHPSQHAAHPTEMPGDGCEGRVRCDRRAKLVSGGVPGDAACHWGVSMPARVACPTSVPNSHMSTCSA